MGKRGDISLPVRKLIVSHHLERKSLREISTLLKVSIGAIRNAIKVSLRVSYFFSICMITYIFINFRAFKFMEMWLQTEEIAKDK